MSDTAKLLIDSKCALGEGPIWHPGRDQLFFFDINNKTLFAASADGRIEQEWNFPEMVAAAAIIDDTALAIVTETELQRLDLDTGQTERITDIEKDVPTNRRTDSRVHPSGAFWIGTLVKDECHNDGAVYHYLRGKLTTIMLYAAITNCSCFCPYGEPSY